MNTKFNFPETASMTQGLAYRLRDQEITTCFDNDEAKHSCGVNIHKDVVLGKYALKGFGNDTKEFENLTRDGGRQIALTGYAGEIEVRCQVNVMSTWSPA